MSEMVPKVRFSSFTDDWEERNLGDVTTWTKGQGLTKEDLNEERDGSEAVHYADLYKFSPVMHNVIHWTNSDDGRIIPDNSLLFPASDVTPVGLARASTLRLSGVKAGGDVIIGQLDESINSSFMSYQINANSKKILPLITGTTVKHVQAKSLATVLVSITNMAEQTAIAGIFERIDNLIALHQRKLDLLKEQKKGFLQKMFPKNGAKIPELRFAGFADDWEQRKLKDIANYRNGKAHEQVEDIDGQFTIVNSKFISTNGNVQRHTYKQVEPLFKGEITFVLSDLPNGKALAKVFRIDEDNKYTLNQRIAGITPKKGTDSIFLSYILNRNSYFLKFDSGVSQTNLSRSQVEGFTSTLPCFEEQTEIGSFFKQLDNLITLHQRKLDLLKEQKKGFLQKMFVS